jgi:putative component of membrane protein insertase Oxa1/YidC/SpoIIIJ protein YidD
MGNAWYRHRQRRAERRAAGRRKRDWLDCADCGDCGDCSPLLISVVLLLRVLPGAFRADAVDPWVAPPGGVLGRGAARLIRSYQLNVSLPRSRAVCSMTPTCSRYGLQAVSRHGVWRGGLMVVGRLRRCGGQGPRLDPVPPTR